MSCATWWHSGCMGWWYGYDLNDHDRLRHDPTQTTVGKTGACQQPDLLTAGSLCHAAKAVSLSTETEI